MKASMQLPTETTPLASRRGGAAKRLRVGSSKHSGGRIAAPGEPRMDLTCTPIRTSALKIHPRDSALPIHPHSPKAP